MTARFGHYLVYEQLGAGGMAEVHRAEAVGLAGFRKPVALKRMLPHVAANPSFVAAFVREARLASHLQHRNVAQTYELGKVGTTYFIAMELIDGASVRELLGACAASKTRMPLPIALEIVAQMCDAIDYAHNLCDAAGEPLGIIHRDVTPSNVIVSETGVVKLLDFGIAKATAAGLATSGMQLKGKLGYMAPEYIRGRIDPRADIFAIGVVAHELLTNRRLFTVSDGQTTLSRVLSLDIAPPSRRNPEVPAEIDELVMLALARDPAQRWQRAVALRTALATVTRRLGLAAPPGALAAWLATAIPPTGSTLPVRTS